MILMVMKSFQMKYRKSLIMINIKIINMMIHLIRNNAIKKTAKKFTRYCNSFKTRRMLTALDLQNCYHQLKLIIKETIYSKMYCRMHSIETNSNLIITYSIIKVKKMLFLTMNILITISLKYHSLNQFPTTKCLNLDMVVVSRKREVSYSWVIKRRKREIEEVNQDCLKVQETRMIWAFNRLLIIKKTKLINHSNNKIHLLLGNNIEMDQV